jgi:hypothetical protein
MGLNRLGYVLDVFPLCETLKPLFSSGDFKPLVFLGCVSDSYNTEASFFIGGRLAPLCFLGSFSTLCFLGVFL